MGSDVAFDGILEPHRLVRLLAQHSLVVQLLPQLSLVLFCTPPITRPRTLPVTPPGELKAYEVERRAFSFEDSHALKGEHFCRWLIAELAIAGVTFIILTYLPADRLSFLHQLAVLHRAKRDAS